MKTRLLMVAGALLLLAGCSKDNGADGWREDTPIAVSGVTVSDASASAGGANGAATSRAGLSTASTFNAGLFFEDGTATAYQNFDNSKYAANGLGGMSPVDGPVYWLNKKPLTITAYAPYQSEWVSHMGIYEFTVKDNQSTAAAVEASDLLWVQTPGVSFGSGVSLAFDHKLSKLKITLTPDGTSITQDEWDEESSNLSVTVMNTLPTADLYLFIGYLNPVMGTPAPITAYYDAAADTHEAIIVPQPISAGTVLLEITVGGRNFIYTLPSVQSFASGYEYAYPVTVSRSGIMVGTPSIGEWGGNADNPTIGDTKISYKVGDYWPYNGIPQGVVYWLDPNAEDYNADGGGAGIPTGLHGRVVSLDEENTEIFVESEFEYGVKWGPTNTTTDADDKTDGLANMNTVYTFNNNSFLNYPAFAWCDLKNGEAGATTYASDLKGVWYLPAMDELGNYAAGSLYESFDNYGKDNFNALLTSAGGTALNTATKPFYWSSTEGNGGAAWDVYFYSGYTNYLRKDSRFRVRAILAF